MSFLIAKQAIFNREGEKVAFEIFLRKRGSVFEYPKEVPYSRATYIITEIILEHGIERVGEGKRVMINVSLDSLINKAIESLDPHKLIIEIIEPQVPVGEIVYKQILNAIDRYIDKGVLFCIDEKYLKNEKMSALLDKVSIISVDIKRLNQKILNLSKSKSKTLLISRIESAGEYNKVKNIGDLFQGIYLERPIILKEFQSTPYLKSTLLKLIAMVHSVQSPREIASVISTDVGMTAKILRLANSAYYSPIREITSIEQACAMIGLKNLKNFLLVLAMNDYMSVENVELWKKSFIRALIAQKIAERINPQYESKAYLIGLFSLLDEVLDVDKITFLEDVKIDHEIIDGYTGKNALLRSILDYSIALEEKLPELLNMDDPTQSEMVLNLERLTGISSQELISIAKSSLDTASQVLKV